MLVGPGLFPGLVGLVEVFVKVLWTRAFCSLFFPLGCYHQHLFESLGRARSVDPTDRGEKVTEVFVEFLAKIVKMGCPGSPDSSACCRCRAAAASPLLRPLMGSLFCSTYRSEDVLEAKVRNSGFRVEFFRGFTV